MNKIEFSELKNKEDKQIAFNQLKDDYKILFQEKDKLESNWKALKEWLEKDAFKNLESKGIALTTDEVLNQMAKIELEGDR